MYNGFKEALCTVYKGQHRPFSTVVLYEPSANEHIYELNWIKYYQITRNILIYLEEKHNLFGTKIPQFHADFYLQTEKSTIIKLWSIGYQKKNATHANVSSVKGLSILQICRRPLVGV